MLFCCMRHLTRLFSEGGGSSFRRVNSYLENVVSGVGKIIKGAGLNSKRYVGEVYNNHVKINKEDSLPRQSVKGCSIFIVVYGAYIGALFPICSVLNSCFWDEETPIVEEDVGYEDSPN